MTKIEEVVAAFDQFDLCNHQPAWSSWVLEQWFATFLTNDHGTMTDLLQGFDSALWKYQVRLTDPVAYLIKDVVVMGFTRYREFYDKIDWGWANEALQKDVGPAQAYLFLLALPPNQRNTNLAATILQGLERSTRYDEALAVLGEDREQGLFNTQIGKTHEMDYKNKTKNRCYCISTLKRNNLSTRHQTKFDRGSCRP